MVQKTIRTVAVATICAAVVAVAQWANAHGTPIDVGLSGTALAVSGGTADNGFAPWMFFEDDDEGDPLGTFSLPGVGNVILWEIPGLDLTGLNDDSSLSIETIVRPVRGSIPQEERLVWYWNPATQLVEQSPADMHLLGTEQRFSSLDNEATQAPPPFLLANSLVGQQGFHNHGLLAYGLESLSPTPAGVYGFFARLLSSAHGASEPFLIVLNHGLDYELMSPAAIAINIAADDGLSGDYNLNGVVDAADYAVWRDTLGDANSLRVWKANFGATAGAGANRSVVPEPSCLLLCAFAVVAFENRALALKICRLRTSVRDAAVLPVR
jgi:hypothetical protein